MTCSLVRVVTIMNHFIEVDKSENGDIWLVVHTGSRNLGKQVAEYYQNLAYRRLSFFKEKREQLIAKLKAEGRQREISKALEDFKNEKASKKISKDLAYLEGKDAVNYLQDIKVCYEYAELNRRMIFSILEEHVFKTEPIEIVKSIHNYLDAGAMIIRKGAISAKEGESVVIPLNMRDGVIIGYGKGNEEWNCSAPHGAGRKMSRAQANEEVNMRDFRETMKGIYSTSVCESTKDESPFAYKPSDEIIDLVKDTVTIREVLKPIYNFKAH